MDNNYDTALANFLFLLKGREDSRCGHSEFSSAATFSVMPGRKYDKVVRHWNGQRFSFCFVEKSTGRLFKGNWKGLENPKVPRGSIYNRNPLAGTNDYGMDYLR